MSERILKALMQLFAIIAKVEDNDVGEDIPSGKNDGRQIVLDFLKYQLNQELVDEYIAVFDEYLEAHQGKAKKKDGKAKRTSMNSVKVLRICTQINEELTQKQKIVVLIRILEFINAGIVTEQEVEFATTVADTFNISSEEFNDCRDFVQAEQGIFNDSQSLLIINKTPDEEFKSKYSETKHIHAKDLDGEIRILRVGSVNLYFLTYFGSDNISLNGQNVALDRNYVLTHGSSLRGPKLKPVYQSDIISKFLSDTVTEKIVFKAVDIEYRFKGGNIGLHPTTMIEESGKLIGIMGGSGAGKSTMLNVLNGNYKPTEGKVTINGIDIHSKEAKDKTEGVIGYVSQDDLLIEELTVFQNLFYNAKLCFGDLSDSQITKLVLKLLNDLGLYETKDLKVGSPLEKTISGGQRKRVNIGLELIREPSVLFVDEPTSGLSSRDSQNIMDLLKELTLKGKLIFVVIHQPSSDIFKMFDKLLILDLGGYPVYLGNPVDGIQYFKELANYANVNEDTSGNVNPEEIFDIIDAKVVDEFGNLTDKRKVSPKEWYETYKERIGNKIENVEDPKDPPQASFKIPNVFKQFGVFWIRDVLSKITNTQYVLINLLEAPALALILSFFVKYFNPDNPEGEYVFRESENVPQFLFISVVVALFIGLTVSAEEIIKDQKILKREKFLNLSKISYINSKITIMFLISAIQTILYVLVGNYVLEIKDMTFTYWIILFSASCFANMLGLNISASFNSAKVIYILIPILIIPQLLFSGVIVTFDKLHPAIKSDKGVPLIGNVMASRWAYEALAVSQYKDNPFEKKFFELEKAKWFSLWKKDYWHEQMTKALDEVRNHYGDPEYDQQKVKDAIELLRNEIKREDDFLTLKCNCAENLSYEKFQQLEKSGKLNELVDLVDFIENKYLKKVKEHYRKVNKNATNAIDDKIRELQSSEAKRKEYTILYNDYTNESLENFVTNKNSIGGYALVQDGEIIPKYRPIYFDQAKEVGFFEAHFYAPSKRIFGMEIDTKWANVAVIWLMSIILVITLYFDAMKKAIDGIGKLGGLMKRKKR